MLAAVITNSLQRNVAEVTQIVPAFLGERALAPGEAAAQINAYSSGTSGGGAFANLHSLQTDATGSLHANLGTSLNAVVGQRLVPFSVSFFLNPDASSLTGWHSIVDSREAANPRTGFVVALSESFIAVAVQNDVSGNKVFGFTNGFTASADTWYQVTVTYDGANGLKVYVDGTEQGFLVLENSLSGNFTSTGDMLIGMAPGNVQELTGKVDELAFWDKELSGAEVTELQTILDLATLDFSGNLVSWFRMEENLDDSAGVNNGTNAGATFSTDVPA